MVKKVEYQVLKTMGKVELRKYPKILLATVTGQSDDDAFSVLFNYITGSNRKSEKVDMTAPVISSDHKMSFVMPAKFTINNIPKPNNPQVMIEELPAQKLAVIRFKGYAGQKDVNKYKTELLSVLAENNIKTHGEPILMRYNSPFAPGFIRRNELGIKIKI